MIGVGPHGGGGGGGGASLEYNFVAGENINQYQVVYGDTAGGVGRIKLAVNAAEATSRVLGVATQSKLTGAAIKVMIGGQYAMHFAADPTIANFGRPVYLDAVPGQVTLTPPGAGTILIRIGYVVGYGAADALVNIAIGDEFVQ
jgi:hypothetical protein